jgi:lipoteichoic acid synthase
MIKITKTLHLLLYFIGSLLFMETLLRVSTTGVFFSSGALFSFLFSVSVGGMFYIICTLFQGKIRFSLSIITLSISAFIFCSQMIYYKIFRIFYTLYSAGNAAQVIEFWKDILDTVSKNSLWVVVFFLPVIIISVFGRKIISSEKITRQYRLSLLCFMLLSHLLGLTAVFISGRDQYSPYDLYFKSNYPILSVERLGLITTMRLDLQRLISGWSPVLEVSTPSMGNAINQNIPPMDLPYGKVEEVKIEYNIMDIDFSDLISTEKNQGIRDMHNYFQAQEPTAKNKFTGKYKGYNLILITAEAFSPYAVREDVTPTLYKMVHEGYNFTNFYNPLWGVSTSDGEYVACTGLIPKSGIWSFQRSGNIYLPFVMGNQLKRLGYKTVAYHNHTYNYYRRDISHPNMGYIYKGIGNGLNVKKVWPASDLEMMEKTIPEYINNEPFHAYYMTVSGHLRYNFTGNTMALKNKKHVQNLPYSEAGRAYIATQIELDRALEHLLNMLEQEGIADKTLIAVSADHYPYGLEYAEIDELAGHSVERNFELHKSPFILYTKGIEPVTIDKPCSSLDIIPTLSNLLGLEYDSRLLMGKDIFSNSDPLVIFLNKSFITDKGRYNAKTGEFIPKDGVTVDDGYVNRISTTINSKFHYSARILDTDYYRKVIKN